MFRGLSGSAVVLIVAIFSMATSGAIAAPGFNCNGPGAAALQDVIDAASDGDVITVKGHCNGTSYVIATAGLTLRGMGNAKITGDGDAPALTIIANRVTIENWDVIDGGAGVGIAVRANGSANIIDIDSIKGFRGVVVTQSAFANIVDSVISDDREGVYGIFVTLGGNAHLEGSDVSNNGRRGILITNTGSVELGNDNTITGNGEEGIFILHGSLTVTGINNILTGNVTKDLPNDNDINCFNFSRIAVTNLFANTSPPATENFGECRLTGGESSVFSPAL